MPFIDELERVCTENSPTDIMIQPGQPLVYFINDRLVETGIEFPVSEVADFLSLAGLKEWVNDENHAFVAGKHRLRGNFFRTRDFQKAVLRRLPNEIPSVVKLGLPQHFVDTVAAAESGLVLVCGPMGSGKSTSLASLVQHRLTKRDDHCVTIENPIEYIINGHYKMQVSQREVGRCVKDYSTGLKSALRQRAKTILVQEIIDPESAITAVNAAMTGHFVVSTLHTGKVGLSIEALMKLIPESRYQSILTILPQVLRGVICQRLIKKSGSQSVFAIHELLMPTVAISNIIRTGKFQQIESELETGSAVGHISFRRSLRDAAQAGNLSSADKTTLETALSTQ